MKAKDYQAFVFNDIVEYKHNQHFYTTGASEEVGELSGISKRIQRGDKQYQDMHFVREKTLKELGDAFWYLTALCNFYGFSLEEVFQANYDKLQQRDKKGTRLGDGSER